MNFSLSVMTSFVYLRIKIESVNIFSILIRLISIFPFDFTLMWILFWIEFAYLERRPKILKATCVP